MKKFSLIKNRHGLEFVVEAGLATKMLKKDECEIVEKDYSPAPKKAKKKAKKEEKKEEAAE